MSLKAGIVGLPNVGKSTLFNTLLSREIADAANYPFCTIEPNTGIVEVPDLRLSKLANVVQTEKTVPAAVEIVDIAGLVEGAHRGEGLGNKFLSHIREVDLIIFVLRDFRDENIARAGSVHPESDLAILLTELQLADMQVVEKQQPPRANATKEEKLRWQALQKVNIALEDGQNINELDFSEKEAKEIKSFSFLTAKPFIIVLNTDEENLSNETPTVGEIGKNTPMIKLCAKLEADMVGMTREEKQELLRAFDIAQPALDTLIQQTYDHLGLMTFLTAGEKEVRAWPIKQGTKAPAAAGVIHTDFEKGFVKAKVATYTDFIAEKGWNNLKEVGKIRLEGKDYIMQEGDVVEFMIN